MSDISINICTSDAGPERTEAPGGNQRRRRSKWLRKKQQRLDPMGSNEDKHRPRPKNPQGPGGGPVQNGAPPTTRPVFPIFHPQKQSLPRSPSTSTSTSTSTSALHLPSLTITVNNNKGLQGKPKQPTTAKSTSTSSTSSASCSKRPPPAPTRIPTKFVAIDCEMVGTGPKGSVSQLARCSIVSYDGDVVYDKFINPSVPVTDYRTRWSGIRRCDLINAKPYAEARKEILRLLMGKVVIGHAIHNDFKVLGYSHPAALTRDTSRIPLLNQKAGIGANECASLKRLTKTIFNRDIQTGKRGHSSVEDAKATMELYKVVEEEWERRLASTHK